MQEHQQEGMVLVEMMLTAEVDGKRGSVNLILTSIHAFHGRMQK
jgi:hypothetical protein